MPPPNCLRNFSNKQQQSGTKLFRDFSRLKAMGHLYYAEKNSSFFYEKSLDDVHKVGGVKGHFSMNVSMKYSI